MYLKSPFLYNAIAIPNTPAIPARPAAMAAEGFGAAPPVDCGVTEELVLEAVCEGVEDVAEAAEADDADDADEAEAADDDSLAPREDSADDAADAAEDEVRPVKVGLKVLKYCFTLSGSDAYHPGVELSTSI